MNSDMITCSKTNSHIEIDCEFTHEGKTFSASGSFLTPNKKTGKLEGLLYAKYQTGFVGSWDGSIEIPALFLQEWSSSFGDMRQLVKFEYQGKKFSGIWYRGKFEQSQIVRVKEIEQ